MLYVSPVIDETEAPVYGTVVEALEVLSQILPRGVPLPSPMTLRRAGARGEIATYQLGRNVYFDLDSVRSWAKVAS